MNDLFLEGSFTLTESLGQVKIYGVAIHPVATTHPNEWPERRVYEEVELKAAAPSVVGKQLTLDHQFPLDGCKVTVARWDDKEKGVYFEALITPQIAAKIRNGFIKKVSINCNPWRQGGGMKFVDGVAPFGFVFEDLSLLENMEPGDPTSWVKLLEAMESQEFVQVTIKDMNAFKDDGFRETQIAPDSGITLVHGTPKEGGSFELAFIKFYKKKGWTRDKIESWLRDNPQYAPQIQAQTPTPQILEARGLTSEERLRRRLDGVERTPLQRWRKSHE
jgi:hypothetical protein